jgi:hypothetical protein
MTIYDLSNDLNNDLSTEVIIDLEFIILMITNIFNTIYELFVIILVRTYNYIFVNVTNTENISFIEYTKQQEQLVINKGYLLLKNISYNISWKLIEICALTNEYYNKSVIPKFNELTNNYFKISIIFVKDGEEILKFKNNKMLLEYGKNNIPDYDFILYTEHHINNPKKNYTLISDEILNNEYKGIAVPSDVGFIIFQVEYNNTNYDINFKEPHNYLINNNVIKPHFFNYYMKKTHNIKLSDNYKVTYMTNNCVQSCIKYPFFIKFSESGLTSFPLKQTN